MLILYLPLDDRPCNLNYPQYLAQLRSDLNLIVPPRELLGWKKRSSPLEQLWAWTEAQFPACAAAIVSVEQWVYGGLLPSRLHQETAQELLSRWQHLMDLHQAHPQVSLYASTVIMRCPTYNSSEEEPDYYQDWGAALFRYGWLAHKAQLGQLTAEEAADWSGRSSLVPPDILADYQHRRATNRQVTQGVLASLHQGQLSTLCIPQDDAAVYGFTALDQQQIRRDIAHLGLNDRVHLYPGADEVGCTLLARAYQEKASQSPTRFYVLHSTSDGPQIIPTYEDWPLEQSITAHIEAQGCQSVPTPEAADVILGVHSPVLPLREAWDQPGDREPTHHHPEIVAFLDSLVNTIAAGKKVALADLAYTNGGDTALIQALDRAQQLDKLVAYGGWNTCGNTLGTVLATAALAQTGADPQAIQFNLMHRLFEDWLYQAIVRQQVIQDDLPRLGASYYRFQGQAPTIAHLTAQRLQQEWHDRLQSSFLDQSIPRLMVQHPWQRMFEIALDLHLNFPDPPPFDPIPSDP